MMARDYSNLPAAIRDETLERLRESVATALSNAEQHQHEANHYQSIADREAGFAARDAERARQWQKQLDFFELVDADNELAHAFSNAVLDRYAENMSDEPDEDESEPTMADAILAEVQRRQAAASPLSSTPLAVAFGAVGPVEYFDAVEAEDVREIRREMAIEAGDWDPADESDGGVM